MRLENTTSPANEPGVKTIFSAESARHQLNLLDRLRFVLVGLYHCKIGPEWSSNGRLESDYLHHIDIALTGRRQVVFHGEVMDIKPGMAYWFPGNTPLERRCRERCEVVFLKLRCEWLPGVDPFLDWPDRRPAETGSGDLGFWRAWREPKRALTTSRLLQLQARISECVATAVPDLDQVIGNHLRTHAQFQAVFKLIEEKLGADLRVEALAKAHGTSLHAYSMAFSRNTGLSPKAYLKRRLNQEAIQLVINTDIKLKQVAEQLRFCDEYHFSRFFRKANGLPPLAYRRALRGTI